MKRGCIPFLARDCGTPKSPGRWLAGLLACLAGGAFAEATRASDWPQFLGPNRDGVYSGPALSTLWPKEGPPVVWRLKIGQGFSGPVVASGKVILFHRREQTARVDCLDAKEGRAIWSFTYPTDYRDDFGFDEGPRATPAIANGSVFTYGAEGMLHCLNLGDGSKRWSVDVRRRHNAAKGFFGPACSPLVEEGRVLLNVGGANGAGIVAFNALNGDTVWKAVEDEASYSSPVMASFQGIRHALFFSRSGLLALDPAGGKVLFQFPWRSRSHASVNAATPLILGNRVFISASYETGAAMLEVNPEGLAPVWSGDDILSNHYATSVHCAGALYGFDGRQEQGPGLRCVDAQSGRIRWTQPGFGAGTVTLAGNRLLLIREDGQLWLAPASPEGFKPECRAQLLSSGTRACPALASGFLYARSPRELICVDLRGEEPGE